MRSNCRSAVHLPLAQTIRLHVEHTDICTMKKRQRITRIGLILVTVWTCAFSAGAQDQAPTIPDSKIAALGTKLNDRARGTSAARRKLSIRRVIREGESLLKTYPTAPNRYLVLGILFRSRRELFSLDKSASNRKELLGTSRQLAGAPDVYAAVRLDADLLLSQAELARQGADLKARAVALRPLVERYRDTKVEAKVIRVAMLMALEFGDTRLVNHLRQVIAERFAGDLELINFQRDKLAGQVFGAPFIGRFEQADGKLVQFPLDYLGTTTAIYFWSKENGDEEDLKELATAWKAVEANAAHRFQFVSMNMDNLPDAGEGILRGLGLDWPALRMPGGQDNPIFQTYVRRDTPTVLTVSPTGYAALYLSGSRSNRTYERRLQSMLARTWTNLRYASQLQSVFTGEFLVMPTQGDFDPAAPPEWKALASGNSAGDSARQDKLPRTAASVPEDKVRAIQACFIDPPLRYRAPHDQVIANYEKADVLCRAAIEAHPKAPDLWIVRNRRIIALMGLWKMRRDQEPFAAAVAEANAAVESGYPPGAEVVARLCLAREALRAADADPKAVISGFLEAAGGQQASAPALVATTLLALDAGDRKLHDQHRRGFLDKHADAPMMWTATAFLLDRYHRYWLYHPPYTAGWTYGRRQGHFLAVGQPEDAQRTFQAEFRTLDSSTVRIPMEAAGHWTVIQFLPNAQTAAFARNTAAFIKDRPFEDVNLIAAVLDDDAQAARIAIEAKKKPDTFPTLLVPGGMQNPLVRKLGILAEETRPNLILLRPNGSIAITLSGLTMSAQKGNVIQNVIEWHDEKVVDEALALGNLEEAKRLAFAFAPVEEPTPAGEKKKPAKKISIPHLRSRAKVYLAMGNLKAAYADAEQSYLAVNIRAGYISMRTDELEETETLKATILRALEQPKSGE